MYVYNPFDAIDILMYCHFLNTFTYLSLTSNIPYEIVNTRAIREVCKQCYSRSYCVPCSNSESSLTSFNVTNAPCHLYIKLTSHLSNWLTETFNL